MVKSWISHPVYFKSAVMQFIRPDKKDILKFLLTGEISGGLLNTIAKKMNLFYKISRFYPDGRENFKYPHFSDG